MRKKLSCEQFCIKHNLSFLGCNHGNYYAPMAILSYMNERSECMEINEMEMIFDSLSSDAKKCLLKCIFVYERNSGIFNYWNVDMKIAIINSLMK